MRGEMLVARTDDSGGSTGGTRARPSPLARLLLVPVHLWRWSAPMRMPRCRFHPTCSTYALDAIRSHGALQGGWLALRRLLRCHPWNPGGIDHVPPPGAAHRNSTS